MRRYLLDTNAVGDWLNRRHGVDLRVREARSRGAVIGICEPVAAEPFFGVENSDTRNENAERLKRAPANKQIGKHHGQAIHSKTGNR